MTDTLGSRDGEPTHGSNTSPWADMIEATRLTGLGRLNEATALIQRSFGNAPQAQSDAAAPEAQSGTVRDTAESAPRVREVVGQVVRGLAPVLKGLGKPLRQPAPPADSSVPPGGRFVALSHTEAAGGRDYKLFIPSRPDARAPLVVMLHGCTQNPDDFAAGTGMNTLAERAGVFVAYPAQSRQAHAQRCWNWYDPRDQARGSGEPAIITGLTRAIVAEHPIDPARIYIAGLSAGGAAALTIARAYPDLYAAVGVHSGLAAGCARDLGSALMAMQVGAPGLAAPTPFGAPATATRVPTIIFHGEDDGTVSVRNADQVLAQANVAGLTARSETLEGRGHPFTRTRYRDSSDRVVVEDWRVRGAGHAWSGGHPEGSYTDRDGPDASRAMLDFFAEHRLGPKRR
ncbi:PHB depolymerase family esterase [Methylobacterium sp. E-005]|uniref:extracellular catalytic domain type 1 short-chain-length polyhydroxyalkanoate depolymerase n=1 Tax=Methylobacterium sp. E-005 TaxID=2836549 RepID=UPI001FB9DC6B|nr:PHB depolymerase family esterase [Methylobacterium sp. E-005]MCJ2089003.1 PHB depolymerase family esterase [Methylobacterium sp. E-005]